jgi:hypothetical protein
MWHNCPLFIDQPHLLLKDNNIGVVQLLLYDVTASEQKSGYTLIHS